MANTLLTISQITEEALPVLANHCILTDKFNRQYNKEFGVEGRKVGGTVNVRVPPRYQGTFGPALNVEPSTENYFPVNILYQFHVDMQFSTANLVLDISDFMERFVNPACAAVANRIDSDGAYFAMQNTANRVGTPGTSPTSYKAFSDARAYLVAEGMPKGRTPSVVLSPFANSSMSDSLKGLFNPQVQIGDMYEEGMITKKTAGADWYEDANIANYTTGSLLGTPVLAGGTSAAGGTALLTTGFAQTGTLELSGLTNSSAACKVGDTLTILGVYPVNPQNRSQYSNTLKNFVVLPPGGYAQTIGVAAPGGPAFASATLSHGTFNATTGLYTANGSGLLTVTIGECVISGGQFQNVSAAPVSPFTVVLNSGTALGTNSTENLYFDRDAFALAMVDLPLPTAAVKASRAYDEDLGMSIRICTQYTINNDSEPTRLDVAYGFGSLYRPLAVRVSG